MPMRSIVLAAVAEVGVWAYLELRGDLTFAHQTPAQRRAYVEGALQVGEVAAQPFLGQPPLAVAEQLGVRVELGTAEGGSVRAAYGAGLIELNQPSLAALAAQLEGLLAEPPTVAQLTELALAHELFHHLEVTQLGRVDHQLPPVITLRLGRLWARRTPVRACREIAAHRFAQVLLNWPYFPGLLDWLLVGAEQGWGSLAEAVTEAQQVLSFKNQP